MNPDKTKNMIDSLKNGTPENTKYHSNAGTWEHHCHSLNSRKETLLVRTAHALRDALRRLSRHLGLQGSDGGAYSVDQQLLIGGCPASSTIFLLDNAPYVLNGRI